MSDSDHLAIGPALAYPFQFDRATYRLLQADSSVAYVAVEHVDDVSVHHSNGQTIREQDKMTVSDRNPLTDRSVALWKTIAIWSDAVLADQGGLNYTEFHLVTNGKIPLNSLAARIHAAKSPPLAASVASELLGMAKELRDDLQPFAAKVLQLGPDLLSDLVGNTYVLDNVAASFGGKLEDLQSLRLLGDLQRAAVFDHAVGWVRRRVLTAARESKPTLIDRVAFDREIKALFRRVAVAPLAVVFDTQESGIDPASYQSHGFFQQLDWIDTDPSFVRDCVIHYIQARAARVKWTDADAVSEASLRAYEEDLKTRWKLQVRRQSQRAYPSPVVQGQDLLTETLSEDTSLDGQPMPKAITCGSFHALADFDKRTDPKIGWHPEFEKMAKADKEKS